MSEKNIARIVVACALANVANFPNVNRLQISLHWYAMSEKLQNCIFYQTQGHISSYFSMLTLTLFPSTLSFPRTDEKLNILQISGGYVLFEMKDLYITCDNTGFLNQHQNFLNSNEEMIVVYITDIHITCIAAEIHKKARILVTTQHRRVHLECLPDNCLE